MKQLITVFYNESKGYIIEAQGKAKEIPVYVVINPVDRLPSNANKTELADKIKNALLKSLDHEEIDLNEAKKYQYWKDLGCKSYRAFSKLFDAVEVEVKEDVILKKLIRDKQGAYEPSDDENDCVILTGEIDYLNLASIVRSLLDLNEKEQVNKLSGFKTLGKAEVIYNEPLDDLVDCGDGGTDAYQIYEEPDTSNYIAFLIDNGYKEFNEACIKNKLETQYGVFNFFEYNESGDGHIIVKASNNKCMIESNLFYKECDSVEVLCYIEGTSKIIKDEYSGIINSIHIKW